MRGGFLCGEEYSPERKGVFKLWRQRIRWVVFIGKNQRRLGGTSGHRTFGEMLFHLTLVNGIGPVSNASFHEVIDPLRWVWKRGLNRLVAHVTEIQCDGRGLIFIHDEIARAAEVGHYILLARRIFERIETRED